MFLRVVFAFVFVWVDRIDGMTMHLPVVLVMRVVVIVIGMIVIVHVLDAIEVGVRVCMPVLRVFSHPGSPLAALHGVRDVRDHVDVR